MSSILDALKKIEATSQAPVGLQPVGARERRWAVPFVVGAVALAFGTGAGLALWIGSRPAPAPAPVNLVDTAAAAKPVDTAPAEVAPVAPVPAPEPPPVGQAAPAALPTPPAGVEPAPAEALPAAAPALPPPRADLEADPPRGRVATATPPAVAPPVASRPEPRPHPVEEPPEVAAPEPTAAAQDASLLPRLPAGAPHVLVNVLLYSPLPERRTVSLTVDGSSMVTLREGESLGTIEVTRILPERIHVRYDGRLFAVDVRD